MGIFDLFKSKKKKEEANKYRIGMEKTRKSGAFSRLKRLFSNYNEITEDLFDELEEIFVMADIGVDTVVKFIDELKDDERVKTLTSAKDLQPIIIDKMFDIQLKGEVVNSNLRFNKEGLSVFLFVGVNGVGKTTTIAKIASKLINVAGSSAVLDKSFITYSEEAKCEILGVNKETIDKYGVVSLETAVEMVKGVCLKGNCNVGVSVTGYAGPTGGTIDTPVGTVWYAIKINDEIYTYKKLFKSPRNTFREKTMMIIYYHLYQALKKCK